MSDKWKGSKENACAAAALAGQQVHDPISRSTRDRLSAQTGGLEGERLGWSGAGQVMGRWRFRQAAGLPLDNHGAGGSSQENAAGGCSSS